MTLEKKGTMMNERIFREYDIRGIVGDDIDREIALSLGKAFGTFVRGRKPGAKYLSVGRDVRNGSEDLASAITEGIVSTGLGVYDIGVCPTPVQYFSLFHLGLDGGVMVTGSHNPPEYNGFKLSLGRETIHGEDIQTLKSIMKGQERPGSGRQGAVKRYNILDAYRGYMLKEFGYLKDRKFRRLKVVVDAGNGTAGIIAPYLFEQINCDVRALYCEPDGNFPNHHPDPTVVEYIADLIAETKRWKADAGIGYDGDSDRIGVVNKNGEIVWGDRLMIALSREVLKRNPGAKIIGDVKCSQTMFDDIRQKGGVPIMWKTGHSLIKQKMRDEGAILAGEFSGHIFIGDRYFGYDDAIYAGLRLIEIMKTTGRDLQELLADVPQKYSTPEIRVECAEDKKVEIVDKMVKKFRDYQSRGSSPYVIQNIDTTDGVRVVLEHGWILVRSSNTQPVIVVRAEADSEDSLRQYKAFIEQEINEVQRG